MESNSTKWHRMTREAVVAELHTDAACGLSRRAARSLYKKGGGNTLFDTHKDPLSFAVRGLMTDPGFLLMLGMLLLLLLFSPVAALSALGVLLLTVCAWIPLIRRVRRLRSRERSARVPRVTVIRDGRPWRVSARVTVPGDLLLLRPGDLVPGDCRLLTGAGIRVLTPILEETGRLSRVESSKHANAVYTYGSDGKAPYYENMLFGGSEVLAGECRAVLVATGSGSYGEAVFKERPDGLGHDVDREAPILRLWGILLPGLAAILFLLSFLCFPEEAELGARLIEFLILVGSGTPGLLRFYTSMNTLCARLSAMEESLPDNRCLALGEHALERFSSMQELFVLGKWGSSDGIPSVLRCAAGRDTATAEDFSSHASSAVATLGEACALCTMAWRRSVSEGDARSHLSFDAWKSFVADVGVDEEALQIRTRSVSLQIGSEGECRVAVQTKDRSYILHLSEGVGLLSHCTLFEDRGRVCALDGNWRAHYLAFAKEAYSDACQVITVVREDADGVLRLLGILALRETLQAVLPSVAEELLGSGMRVTFFLEGAAEEALVYAEAACLPGERTVFDGRSISDAAFRKSRVFIGYPTEEIGNWMKSLRAAGRRVAILGGGKDTRRLFPSASMLLTCDPSVATAREALELPMSEGSFDGEADSPRGLSILCHKAALWIPRAGRYGGGLSACLTALSAGRALERRRNAICRFLFFSQLLRLLMLSGFLFLRGLPLAGWQMMLCSWFSESVGVIFLLFAPIPQTRLRRAVKRAEPLEWVTSHQHWFPPLASALFASLTAGLLGLLGGCAHEAAASAIFLSLLLCQMVFLLLAAKRCGMHPSLLGVALLVAVVLLPSVLVLLFSCIFPGFAAVSGMGSWSWLSCLPIFAVGVLLATEVFFGRTAK